MNSLVTRLQSAAKAALVTAAMSSCVASSVYGFVFIAYAFGTSAAVAFSLIVFPPFTVGVLLYRRHLTARGRKVAYLAILICVTSGVIALEIRNWKAMPTDDREAEDARWSELERLVRQDSAFENVQIFVTPSHHIHYAEGTVRSGADLDRLRALAVSCGIVQRLDGPYEGSISLTVAPNGRANDAHQ